MNPTSGLLCRKSQIVYSSVKDLNKIIICLEYQQTYIYTLEVGFILGIIFDSVAILNNVFYHV